MTAKPVRTTRFQEKVYRAVSLVPIGSVTTYAILAARIRCGSSRAVGQALKRNPYAPDVPCHRVIASDLTLGGFQGRTSGVAIRRKEVLLGREGVSFRGGRLVDHSRLYSF